MKKSIAEKEIENSSWQKSFEQGIEMCDKATKDNRKKANQFLLLAMLLLFSFSTIIFNILLFTNKISLPNHLEALELMRGGNAESVKNYFNLFDQKSNDTTIISIVILLISLVGIMLALYRLHIREANKYEHFKIGLIRIRIALVFSSEENLPIASLVENVFNFNDEKNKNKFSSPIPGALTADSIVLFMNKIDLFIETLKNRKFSK
ncbi:hypothetical protein ND856_19000 [Leptospira bandrabouensis]|uniref:hypothetical protein n=1 Tax=Leptospira bandrabouensis TaxID=2484903 RepID=UPI00223DC866|nr:hypothetical protein [Leptospira bandrabouensis]MCW7460396.1 hypothetical protein [Leptospira bandrabouensis]MCW7479396.1 hypothetical protein [Leptospira bandrabouensis]MCW7487087.1 hypothetical protein [Leptospira bandrabouensis]